MNVLVVGNGGREHAICWKLRHDGARVWCAPGSVGISEVATCVQIDTCAFSELIDFVKANRIDFTVVGPEKPLSAGIVDAFREAGLPIVGPSLEAAQLEASKAFAKEIMAEAGVPTAKAEVFSNPELLKKYCEGKPFPQVLKADGLAAGKGVVIAKTPKELEEGIDYLVNRIGANQVLVEEFLDGVEATLIVVTNGTAIATLPTAHDYKRVGDGDAGPNTGGMGAISPTPRLTVEETAWAVEKIVKPMLRVMRERGTPFTGFLYAGLMIPREPVQRPNGIKVLEFNARLGDPECQAILPRIKSNFVELMKSMSNGIGKADAPDITVEEHDVTTACIVMASRGYPDDPKLGDLISGLDAAGTNERTLLFHAGTKIRENYGIVTSGGRVLNVVAIGSDRESAVRLAYDCVARISFDGVHARTDIGS